MNDRAVWGNLSGLPCRTGHKAGWKARPTNRGPLRSPYNNLLPSGKAPNFSSPSMGEAGGGVKRDVIADT